MSSNSQGRSSPANWALAAALALSLGSIGMLAASAGRISASVAVGASVVVAIMAVFGLPSIGSATSALVVQALAGLAMIRVLAVPGADPSWILSWAVGLVATLVLAVGVGAGRTPALGAASPGWIRPTAKAVAVVAVIVLIATVLFGPAVANRIPQQASTTGKAPAESTLATLLDQNSLDMTQDPKLSNEIVMTVRSPVADYWRGEVFDVWNGHSWSRSDPRTNVIGIGSGPATVVPAPEDIGAESGAPLTQTFHMLAPASTVIFGAPSLASVNAPVLLIQRPDGTVDSGALGAGSTYTVTSRRTLVTAAQLAADRGPIPVDIRRQYAAAPVATARTVAAAQRVTRGISSEYGKVVALEDWMSSITKYSIHAPPAPKGVDVVDDFLFKTKRGWCAQIASSLVVLLRSIGVPARLDTGFVSDSVNRLTDEYTVRAKDAHAWTEVWFPGIGWQSFDPTAHVPLSGDPTSHSAFGWLRSHLWLVLAILLVVMLALNRSRLPRWAGRRSRRDKSWAPATLRRLDRLGAKAGRPRQPHETATAYGGVLAGVLSEDELAGVGELVDDHLYRPEPVPPQDRAAATATLTRIESR